MFYVGGYEIIIHTGGMRAVPNEGGERYNRAGTRVFAQFIVCINNV